MIRVWGGGWARAGRCFAKKFLDDGEENLHSVILMVFAAIILIAACVALIMMMAKS